MKISRCQRIAKPPIIKRNPAHVNYFHRQENPVELPHSSRQENRNGKFNFRPVPPPPVADKNWWTPIWSGLVTDETGKHQKAMRQAIWLYLFLLTAANRRNGILFRRISTVARETGFNRRSVERWLRTLRDKGYIETRSTGHALHISITKWKPISRNKSP